MINEVPQPQSEPLPPVTPAQLKEKIGVTSFAFRGYNVTNMGKSPELLAHPVYGRYVEQALEEASRIASDTLGQPVDLVTRVRERQEGTLANYGQTLLMIVAVERAQIRILEDVFEIPYPKAHCSLGYSLGEIAALVASGVYPLETAYPLLLALGQDASELAANVTMGVLFSRGERLDFKGVQSLCQRITAEGKGTIGISSFLAPNAILILGQGRTVQTFKKHMRDEFSPRPHLRINPDRWPPIHTPIVRQHNLCDRTSVRLETAAGGFTPPVPRVLSLLTGNFSYDGSNSRDMIRDWVDHPQRLWDAITTLLESGVEMVMHVGPEPNIIPATLSRLENNVLVQLSQNTLAGFGMWAVSGIARRRPWLARMVRSDANLLRAPYVRQVMLEDWLLEQRVSPRSIAVS